MSYPKVGHRVNGERVGPDTEGQRGLSRLPADDEWLDVRTNRWTCTGQIAHCNPANTIKRRDPWRGPRDPGALFH
jgi:hypothetical protein